MLKKTIASAFKSKGKRKMDRKELTYTLSFDLKYFSHETSKKVVEHAERKGLLKEINGIMEPSFEIDEEAVEPDFKPDVNRIFSDESVFERTVDRIASATGRDRNRIIADINLKQLSLGNVMNIEVVALIHAAEIGLNVIDLVDDVEGELEER